MWCSYVTPWTVAHQAPLSMDFSRQEYWSGLPFPSPGDLPDPGIKSKSPSLLADSLSSDPLGKPHTMKYQTIKKKKEIMPFVATWMDLKIITLSEVSQKEKDKYYIVSLICVIYNMTQINLHIS